MSTTMRGVGRQAHLHLEFIELKAVGHLVLEQGLPSGITRCMTWSSCNRDNPDDSP